MALSENHNLPRWRANFLAGHHQTAAPPAAAPPLDPR
jgi:hypothetical protein